MIDPQISTTGKATRSTLRQFAALWLVLFSALAASAFFRRNSPVAAGVFAVLAVAVGPIGLLKPEAIRPLFTGLVRLTQPIGSVVSRILLAVLLYGLFTPVALLFRAIGRDTMNRRFDRKRDTYWTPKKIPADPRRYFRPY